MVRIEKAGAQSADKPFTFVLSTDDTDRMGDVVVQSGISLAHFRKNPVALFGHSHARPVGTWENIRREGNALLADLKLATRGTSRWIDEVRALIEQRILRAASIGFGVEKSEPIDAEKPYGGQRYTKTELFEASIVAVPANPNALMLRSLSEETRALLFPDAAGIPPQPAQAHQAVVKAIAANTPEQGKRMNIAEKIKAARDRIAQIDTRVKELEAVAEAVETLDDKQAAEVSALAEERAAVEKNIANHVALEEVISKRAQPVGSQPGARYPVPAGGYARQEEKGMLLTRMALASVYGYIERKPIDVVVKERFGHDQRVEAVLRSTVPIADSTSGGWAAELVRQDVQGFVESLVPVSIYGALSSRGTVVNFGDAGSVSIPYRAGGNTDVAGSFVGESGVIPVKRTTFGAQVLNRYKMAVITAITKELARCSTPQAEGLLRRFMLEDTGVALDNALLSNAAAVAGTRPAGLLNGIAPIAASAVPGSAEKALADLTALMNALAASGNGIRPVFVVNPAQKLALSTMINGGEWLFRDEVASGRLMGVDLVSSLTVPVGDVILVDAANFATGLGSPEFDTSEHATLVMANADAVAPTHATDPIDSTIVGVAEQVPPDGGITVYKPSQRVAGKVGENAIAMSMFQQWSIALRTVLPLSWGKLRAGSVQWIDNVGW